MRESRCQFTLKFGKILSSQGRLSGKICWSFLMPLTENWFHQGSCKRWKNSNRFPSGLVINKRSVMAPGREFRVMLVGRVHGGRAVRIDFPKTFCFGVIPLKYKSVRARLSSCWC
ncbi:hypothetical protein RRG08_036724 [Elysia crispata]|uniref:Uncharacterized protein n=1 Tax=Elysia crispata TaxID=231223 RepID=A0AAE0XUJ1_9GAST|nr:hypothetical protein RRG08_036724 [Elysia crispata]